MPGVSKEQIAAAKQMTAIEFLRRFRPNELVRSGSRGEFQLREHDSFKINGESSIWHLEKPGYWREIRSGLPHQSGRDEVL